MASENDPLEELRRIADAWHQERYRHATDLAILRDTCDREHKAGCAEILRLKSERDELQAELGTSMPLPLDADGVPCRIGDVLEWEQMGEGRRHGRMVGIVRNGHGLVVPRCDDGREPCTCRHVAPKPETIEDVRKSKDDLVAFLAQSGVMGWKDLNSFAVDFSAVLERAYECGMRDSCARGGYADPSVLGGDAS